MDTRHPGIRTCARRRYLTPQSFRKPYYDRSRSFPRTLVSIDFSPLSCGLRVRGRGCGRIHDRLGVGQTSIFENGTLLAEGERFRQDGQITVAEIDLDLLRQERAAMGTFHDNRLNSRKRTPFRRIQFSVNPPEENIGLARTVERFPFVPSDESSRIAMKHTTFKSPDLCSVYARSDRSGW